MLKDAHSYRRLVVPITLAVLVLCAFAPAALAVSNGSTQPKSSTVLKQQYLALGDSLAFGVQPNGDFTHGYVNDLFQVLQNEGTQKVTNYGCPGETSTTFITGGCPFAPAGFVQLAPPVAFVQPPACKVS